LYLLTANGDNDKIIRISEVKLEEVTKFTSSESDDNFTILYLIFGVAITGITAGMFVIKRKNSSK
jgi:LPXTG-motif cell wall-anchored protein